VQVALNPPSACYCIPGNSDCTDGDIITNVLLGTLNNPSACGTNGYTNYTANASINIPNITAGAGNPVTISAGTGAFTQSVAIWIDYDKSGTFDASEFTFLGTSATPTVRNGVINVPANAQLGQTRMRVRTRFNTALTATNACTSYAFGETEDYTVNIVPCVPVALTSQPANASATCGNNTSFSVTATGSLPSFVWQYRITPTSPWLNVPNVAPYSGVTTATLTLTAITDNLNGYQYRALFQGGCSGTDFSAPATLTVNRLLPAVNPASASICLGSVQQLSLTNSVSAETTATFSTTGLPSVIPDNDFANPLDKVITVSGIPAGSIIKNIRVRMNVNHTWAGDLVANLRAPNGQVLNLFALLNGGTGSNNTANFTNTIIDSLSTAAISGAPAPRTGSFAAERFGITAPAGIVTTTQRWAPLLTTLNGNWTVRFADGFAGDIGTVTALDLIIVYTAPGLAEGVWNGTAGTIYTDAAATTLYTGTVRNSVFVRPTVTGVSNYTVSYATALCQSSTTTVPVTVVELPTSATAVTNRAICVNGNTTFTSTVTGGAGFGLQWQVSTDAGSTFNNVAGANYSGATTNTLTITNAPASFNNYRYRLSATAAPCAGAVNSAAGTLTVNPLPVVVISANPLTELYPGQTTTLSAAVSPNPGATYTWFRNGVPVAGATRNTLVVDVDGLGIYRATVTDVNGCSGSSTTSIEIKDAANDILFIYPSPNSGQFQVRFFSGAGNNPLPRIINIYDNKGSRIFTKTYTIAVPYTRMDVDLKNHGKGIYNVELSDGNGRRLKTGRVVIN
jgi:subtilisin-like proprotein convertase family protein